MKAQLCWERQAASMARAFRLSLAICAVSLTATAAHGQPLLAGSFWYNGNQVTRITVGANSIFSFEVRAQLTGSDASISAYYLDVHPLARFSSLHVLSGARFAGTNRLDVTSTRYRKPRARKQVSPFSQLPPETTEFLLPDRKAHWPVSEQAAFRIDWSEFSSRCSRQSRLIMRLLAAGYRRKEVARRLRITPPAITQRMQAVGNRWQEFQAS